MEEFARNLIPADAAMLERGDPVYERVKWGMGSSETKYKRWRVRSTERDVALVTDPDRPRDNPRKIRLGNLWMEPVQAEQRPVANAATSSPARPGAAQPPSPAEPSPAPERAPNAPVVDEDLAAWLEMGRSMLDGIDRTEADLAGKKQELEKRLAEVDERHRGRIEALEQDLTEARREHADDRAFVVTRLEGIERRIEAARGRRKQIGQMLGKEDR